MRACVPVQIPSTSVLLTFIPAISVDMILLLIILAGLIVLRRDGGGVLGLTRLIWKQVRSQWRFSLAVEEPNEFLFHKGIIWLIIASAFEIPSLVSPAGLIPPFSSLTRLCCRCSPYCIRMVFFPHPFINDH